MKKYIAAISTTLLLASAASADIAWSVTGTSILGPDDRTDQGETSFTTPLVGNRFNSGSGYFVQLLYAGLDGIANPIPAIVPNGFENDAQFGARGDDVVVATRWVGAGSGTAGQFNAGNAFAADITGGQYFVRAWAGISQDAGNPSANQSGLATARLPAPLVNGNVDFWWYGDSPTILNEGDGDAAPIIRNYNYADAGFVANNLVQTIPEPSSFALIGLGGIFLAARRLRRKK